MKRTGERLSPSGILLRFLMSQTARFSCGPLASSLLTLLLIVLVHHPCNLFLLGHLGCVSTCWYRRLTTYQCSSQGSPISLLSPQRSAYFVPIQCLHSSCLFWNHSGRVQWSSRFLSLMRHRVMMDRYFLLLFSRTIGQRLAGRRGGFLWLGDRYLFPSVSMGT